jgi:lipid-A-disaccharide synthase
MRYYLIAGEASGDLHAANLVREIHKLDKDAVIRAWGGDKLAGQGAEIVVHYRHMGFMGFVEVLANIHTILGFLKKCKADILNFKPDAVILIDYPGFNLRIAQFAHRKAFRVFYYISPQVWAWKRSRVYQIKFWVDRLFVILPFEKDFYNRFGVDVDFVGHPLLDAIKEYRRQGPHSLSIAADSRPVIALLPGSRPMEISRMLGVMLSVIPGFPQYRFVIAGATSIPEAFYKKIIGSKAVELVFNQTYALLNHAHAALVTSGTATLETALFGIPQVVCYRGSRLSYLIAKQLVNIKYISLVNLIADQKVVTELIQGELQTKKLSKELKLIADEGEARHEMLANYKALEKILGGAGASAKTATLILEHLQKKMNQ